MARVYGELPAVNSTTLVFLSDGVTVDRPAPGVAIAMYFGLIGGALTATARGRNRRLREAAEVEVGREGCVALAKALERGRAIPWDTVSSVTLAAYGKWGYHLLTIAKQDGSQEYFKYLDRKSDYFEGLSSWLAKAPNFKVGPQILNRQAVARAKDKKAPRQTGA